jgi:hypothetical protein
VAVENEGGATAMKSWWTLLRAEWDRVTGVVLVISGAAALFLGYRGVAGSPFVSVQLPYIISGGLGGLFLCGVGVALLVMADLHDEWRKLDRIEAAILGHWTEPPLDSLPETETERTPAIQRHRAGVGIGSILAVVVLVAAWDRAAGSAQAPIGFQSVAVGSFAVVLTVAVATVVIVGRRSELTRRRAALLGAWSTSSRAVPPSERSADSQSAHLLITPESRRFHRPQCPTLAGLEKTAVRRDAVPPGLEPCGICGAS